MREQELENKRKEEIEGTWESELRRMKRGKDYEEVKIVKKDADGNIKIMEIIVRRTEHDESRCSRGSMEDETRKRKVSYGCKKRKKKERRKKEKMTRKEVYYDGDDENNEWMANKVMIRRDIGSKERMTKIEKDDDDFRIYGKEANHDEIRYYYGVDIHDEVF